MGLFVDDLSDYFDASMSSILGVRCLYARIHRGLTSGHTAIVVPIVEEGDLE